ncbi:MAG: hypothetical protein HKN91_09905 [Acidimicrobiia bacterium]|nr:hypothetical protein [Acidimicrobiia bacterium]
MDTPEPPARSAATVSVVSAIDLPGLETFLVLADVVTGQVRAGMDLVVPVGSTAKRKLRIHGVGPTTPADSGRVGLAFESAAWDQLAGMGDRAMVDGTVMEVHQAGTP